MEPTVRTSPVPATPVHRAVRVGAVADRTVGSMHTDADSTGRRIDILHVPEDAGAHREGLERVLRRIPPGWGRWISCGAGWYELIVRLDEQIGRLAPDYEVHQVKEKFGALRYYWTLPPLQPTCCVARMLEDPRPTPGAVSGPWAPKHRTAEAQARLDAWWAREQEHLASDVHRAAFDALESERARRALLTGRIRRLVAAAERVSSVTCERCGAAGETVIRDWHLSTLCVACRTDHGYLVANFDDLEQR